MPLSRTARFKAAFGRYAAADLGAWRGEARAAVTRLEKALQLLAASGAADEAVVTCRAALDEQREALRVAAADDGDAARACGRYKAIAAAATTAADRAQAASIAARPGADALRALAGAVGGPAALDQLVAEIGTSADSQPKKDFLTAAIQARFGLDSLTGDLSTKALPRLYELLRRLPSDHTVDNDELKHIDRHKVVDASSYKDGRVVINASTAGRRGRTTAYRTDTGDHQVKSFDAMTLHEVGHAVEDSGQNPLDLANTDAFGAWREESTATLLALAEGTLGFGAAFAGLSGATRKELLEGFLYGREVPRDGLSGAVQALRTLGTAGIAADAGVVSARQSWAPNRHVFYNYKPLEDGAFQASRVANKAAIEPWLRRVFSAILRGAQPTDQGVAAVIERDLAPLLVDGVDWDGIPTHAAAVFLKAIHDTPEGNWRKSDGELAVFTVGGRVYQQSYENKYCSYLAAARATKLRPYQFRAAGEWFAEVYAMYFLGLLGQGHAAYAGLRQAYGDPPRPM